MPCDSAEPSSPPLVAELRRCGGRSRAPPATGPVVSVREPGGDLLAQVPLDGEGSP